MHRLSLDPFDVTQDIDGTHESGRHRLQQGQSGTGSGFRVPKEIPGPGHCPPVRHVDHVMVLGPGSPSCSLDVLDVDETWRHVT